MILACGDGPVTIFVAEAIEVGQPTVIEGAGQVTLDGGGSLQILVVGTDQSLSVGNLLFTNGVASSSGEADGIGGAAAGNWRSAVEVIGFTSMGNRSSS